MKCVIPFYTNTCGSLPRDYRHVEIELLFNNLFSCVGEDEDTLTIVSDNRELIDKARQTGVIAVQAEDKYAASDSTLLPRGGKTALAQLVGQGLLDTNTPVMVIDAYGPGMSSSVRRAAWQRFKQGDGESLISVEQPHDHPVQVRSYHFMQPLGIAYFDLSEVLPGQRELSGIPLVFPFYDPMEDCTYEAFLALNRPEVATLYLQRSIELEDEILNLYAVTHDNRLYPLKPSFMHNMPSVQTSKGRATPAAAFPLDASVKAVLALHMAEDKSRRSSPLCAVPILFEGSPWVLAQPNHLYAVNACINTATGRPILGRQEFPHILSPTRTLAIVAQGRIDDLDQDIASGRCIGFVSDEGPSTTAELLSLLRSGMITEPVQEISSKVPKPLAPLFPERSVEQLRQYQQMLATAMDDLDSETGETAAFVKGFFDFLYETTMRK